ncbi:hypothetical protein [Blastochloris tepida]|nr:hypothetical protein [Blastochloris tepida]
MSIARKGAAITVTAALWAGLALFVYWVVADYIPSSLSSSGSEPVKNVRADALARRDVEVFVRTFLDDAKSTPTIARRGAKMDHLEVVYEMPEAWSVTSAKRRFLREASEIIPQVFAGFPDVSEVEITGVATLTDIRGQENKKRVIRIAFDRTANAEIRWEGVLTENVPQIATRYWHHPALDEQ